MRRSFYKAFAAAFLTAFVGVLSFTGCTRYNVAEPLDSFSSKDAGTLSGKELAVEGGTTWFAGKDYTNFILTGEARTEPDAEAYRRDAEERKSRGSAQPLPFAGRRRAVV